LTQSVEARALPAQSPIIAAQFARPEIVTGFAASPPPL
jgi:hypothetical protein